MTLQLSSLIPYLSIILVLSSCNYAKKTNSESIKIQKEASLQEKLQSLSDSIYDVVKKKKLASLVSNLKKKRLISLAKTIGEKAVDFNLEDIYGGSFFLKPAYQSAPVIITWYRGSWCRFCSLTLSEYNKKLLPTIKKLGAHFVVITPEIPDSTLSTKKKKGLDFRFLYDPNNLVAKKYGITYNLNEDLHAFYKKIIKLHEYNNNKELVMPLAATYIIDTTGIIRYAFLKEDYRKRANPKEIIDVLKSIL